MTLNVECGMRNAERRASGAGQRCAEAPPSRFRSPTLRNSGFTLVELLIVISILAILSGLLLGVAARAGESGRAARTKSMVARLHTLVAEYYDTYKERRAPVSASVIALIDSATNSPANRRFRGAAKAEARLYALRELMVLEMPDRWSDVVLAPVDDDSSTPLSQQPMYLAPASSSTNRGPTPINEAYRRQYAAMLDAGIDPDVITDNQGAECLYMIVMIATADGEARSLFNESSIGDTDGDGAPEFLDGWGRPISFLRWAPGFESDLQPNANSFGGTNNLWVEQADADHDPFDLYRSDPFAFRLVPLIFSAGGDESYGIRTIKPSVTWRTGNLNWSQQTWGSLGRHTYFGSRLTPYIEFTGVNETTGESVTAFYGTVRDETATDNIHNHNITSE